MTLSALLGPRPAADHRFGFVVALRARLTDAYDAGRPEWMIAARWGNDGEYLSFAWTGTPVITTEAPRSLRPIRTALAWRPDWLATPHWLLRATLPDGVGVASAFVPAQGHVTVSGDLDIVSEGYDLRDAVRSAWRIEGARTPWIGEFVEAGFLSDVCGT